MQRTSNIRSLSLSKGFRKTTIKGAIIMKMNRKKFKVTYKILDEDLKEAFLVDPGGSYTGKPRDLDVPIQDVDDL